MAHTIRSIQLAQQRKDTPADIQDRINRNKASAHAIAERAARFPVLTADNADEAIAYQETCYQNAYRVLSSGR